MSNNDLTEKRAEQDWHPGGRGFAPRATLKVRINPSPKVKILSAYSGSECGAEIWRATP